MYNQRPDVCNFGFELRQFGALASVLFIKMSKVELLIRTVLILTINSSLHCLNQIFIGTKTHEAEAFYQPFNSQTTFTQGIIYTETAICVMTTEQNQVIEISAHTTARFTQTGF